MKCLIFLPILFFSIVANAKDIQLPQPVKTGGKPLMDCLNQRQSKRNFDPVKSLDNQTLSNMLWAAWGYNRADKRTAPSSRNKQEIEIYVFMKSGTYLWDAKKNVLRLITSEDFRKETAMQPNVSDCAAVLLYVSDKSKIDNKTQDELTAATYANAGFISQNVYLFCASEDIGCVIRAMVKRDKLAKTLALKKDQMILLAQSVGYTTD